MSADSQTNLIDLDLMKYMLENAEIDFDVLEDDNGTDLLLNNELVIRFDSNGNLEEFEIDGR